MGLPAVLCYPGSYTFPCLCPFPAQTCCLHFSVPILTPLVPEPSILLSPVCPQTPSLTLFPVHPPVTSVSRSAVCICLSQLSLFLPFMSVFLTLPVASLAVSLSCAGSFLGLICALHQPYLLKLSSSFTFKSLLKCLTLWEIFPNLSTQGDRLSSLGPEARVGGLLLHVGCFIASLPVLGESGHRGWQVTGIGASWPESTLMKTASRPVCHKCSEAEALAQ